MKRYEVVIDLKGNVKKVREYLEKKIRGANVVSYFEIKLKRGKK